MKIITILGARPQFIIAAMLSKQFALHENINEIITDGKNGLLFSSKEDMVKKINRVINDADYWNVISNNAYESVIKTNLIDNIVDHEYKDYEKLNFP